MFPVVFSIYTIQARSYYLLWAFALLLFLYLSYRRAVKKYRLETSGTVSALLWVYITAILGAFAGVVIEKLPLVIQGKANISLLTTGGSSACMGILIGGIVGLWQLHKEKISVTAFADAVAIPLAIMLCIGRIGCFCEGCCEGKVIYHYWYALHFPCDMPGIYRFPSQLAEGAALGLITLMLCWIEKKHHDKFKGALFAIFMILYGSYRLYFDHYRALSAERAFHSGYVLSVVAISVGIVWLSAILRKNMAEKQ